MLSDLVPRGHKHFRWHGFITDFNGAHRPHHPRGCRVNSIPADSSDAPPVRIWDRLVSSIRSYRSPGARFFKPVCLIAAIDLADEGLLDPMNVDADGIIQRFRRYVGVVYPERADQGWRPLWHLSNDGLWNFILNGRTLKPADFGGQRVPDMRAKLFDRFDRMVIAPRHIEGWNRPAGATRATRRHAGDARRRRRHLPSLRPSTR